MARIVYHLVRRNADQRWHLEQDGHSIQSFATKNAALEAGNVLSRQHNSRGMDAHLVIHREDGSIETEYSYSRDSREVDG